MAVSLTDTVPVSRHRLHDVLECLDVALGNFELAAGDLELLDVGLGLVDEAHPQMVNLRGKEAKVHLGAASDKIDTAHLLVKAVRRSLDDAITNDSLIGKKPRPGDLLTDFRLPVHVHHHYPPKVTHPGAPIPGPTMPFGVNENSVISGYSFEALTDAADSRPSS